MFRIILKILFYGQVEVAKKHKLKIKNLFDGDGAPKIWQKCWHCKKVHIFKCHRHTALYN
jgi:hypothetical protein